MKKAIPTRSVSFILALIFAAQMVPISAHSNDREIPLREMSQASPSSLENGQSRPTLSKKWKYCIVGTAAAVLIASVSTGVYYVVQEQQQAEQQPSLPVFTEPDSVQNNAFLTFYGYDDNDNGKGSYGTSVISDPTIHQVATEDLGTYDHPSTFAADYRAFRAGERIYIPRLQKYYIMEDTCRACTDDADQGKSRADLYIGSNDQIQGQTLTACQISFTHDGYNDVIIRNPTDGHPVDTHPLYTKGICYQQNSN
ncbi:MAG: hypothetical protein ABIQ95_00920 [Bdellovibrionia bacterium]